MTGGPAFKKLDHSCFKDLTFTEIMMISSCPIYLAILLAAVPSRTLAQFDPQPEDYADWVDIINDPTTPLPSCAEIGLSDALACSALCQAIDGGAVDVANTRNVGENFVCTCEQKVACNDEPTCSQLTIQPGRVLDKCTTICGQGFVATVDEVEFAGDITSANKNMTHFVLECRCDGEIQCEDYLLFSDLAEPITCTELEIDSTAACDTYCEAEGGGLFDVGGNFTLVDGTNQGICECLGTSISGSNVTDVAQACTDIPVAEGTQACSLQNPCPTQAPGSETTESGAFDVRFFARSGTTCLVAMTVLLWGSTNY